MIKKRDGHEVPYDREKIKAAVEKAVKAAGEVALLYTVVDDIEREIVSADRVMGVEEIQDLTSIACMPPQKRSACTGRNVPRREKPGMN